MITPKDEELIGLLQVNAREPVAALARKLGLSRTTVQDRLRKLEDSGVIAGYALRLAEKAPIKGISAVVLVAAEPKRQNDVAQSMTRLPQVHTLHSVSGKFDLVAIVTTGTTDQMDKFIDNVIALPGVTDVETSVILSTKLDRR